MSRRVPPLPPPGDANVYVWYEGKQSVALCVSIASKSSIVVRLVRGRKKIRTTLPWMPADTPRDGAGWFAFPIADDGHTAVRPEGAE